MLIIKAYINEREIEEIWVHNTGNRPNIPKDDTYEYRIRKPEGYDHYPIYHKRSNGWKHLARIVLEVLKDA